MMTIAEATMGDTNQHVCGRFMHAHVFSNRQGARGNVRQRLLVLKRKLWRMERQAVSTELRYMTRRIQTDLDWDRYPALPCFEMVEAATMYVVIDPPDQINPEDLRRHISHQLSSQYNHLTNIYSILERIEAEENGEADQIISVQIRRLKRSIRHTMCEIFVITTELNGYIKMNGILQPSVLGWCIFTDNATRYERDIYLLHKITEVLRTYRMYNDGLLLLLNV